MRLDRVVPEEVLCTLVLGLAVSWSQQAKPGKALLSAKTSAESSGTKVAKGSTAAVRTAEPAVTELPSLFDSVNNRLTPVVSTIEVHAGSVESESSQPRPFQAGGQEILSSAGTYGDVSRFLQLTPGVVATSDLSNEILVRGGHPMENLFLVDGIEVPNINHIATAGTTGGFGPMIDSGLIQEVQLYTGGYDAAYPERLSSVTEIRTLDDGRHSGSAESGHIEADGGIQGFGGLADRTLFGGDLLVAAHRGLLSMLGNTLDIMGLPSYTNELSRFRRHDDAGNQLSVLNLAGWDSVDYTPCESDSGTTSAIASQYSGWRQTTGLVLQRVRSRNSFATLTLSNSEDVEQIDQQDQLIVPTQLKPIHIPCPIPAAEYHPTPVYMENSHEGSSTAGYGYEWARTWLALKTGGSVWLRQPHYRIDQPEGAFSPYSVAPVRADFTSFSSDFSTGETGSFAQLTVHPAKSVALSSGGRLQTFAFGGHTTLTPRASIQYRPDSAVAWHLAYAEYGQLPPYVYLLAYPGNHSMLPMRATHQVAGMDLGIVPSSKIEIEAYRKLYTDIPASTEYPSVTLHDMVDMIGDQIVWLPMKSEGRGEAAGIEVSDLSRIGSRLTMRGSVAYSRAKFAGLDGVLRPSNYDFPWIVNFASVARLGHGYDVSSRYGYATGRPYTPFDFTDSLPQNRPIYEISEINALRAPYYSRLDGQFDKDIRMRGLHLELYGGAENILNHSNFLAYVWMPREELNRHNKRPIKELDQMPIFPNFGIRLICR